MKYTAADTPNIYSSIDNTLSAKDIINDPNPDLFAELFDKYYFRSGFSGIQPKIMLDASLQDKATLRTGGYIIKSWADDYPELATNEFFA